MELLAQWAHRRRRRDRPRLAPPPSWISPPPGPDISTYAYSPSMAGTSLPGIKAYKPRRNKGGSNGGGIGRRGVVFHRALHHAGQFWRMELAGEPKGHVDACRDAG